MRELETVEPSYRVPVLGGAALIVFALTVTTVARVSDIGTVRLQPVTAVESKELSFEARADGTVLVSEFGQTDAARVVRPADGDGFVQVALQSLVREREAAGVTMAAPYRLMRQEGGRLWLEDPATQRRLTLDAFGPGSARAFLQLFDTRKGAP